MLARANVITEPAIEQLAGRRHLAGAQAAHTEQAIDRIGGLQHLKLPGGVGPGILRGVGQQHRPRRAQGDETVLIEWQLIGLVVELLEGGVEPVREAFVDLLDRLADLFKATMAAVAQNGKECGWLTR
jgi:hypothetical protein